MASAKLTDMAIFILRITIGVIYLAHGLQRLFGFFGGPGIKGTAAMLSGIGFAPTEVWAWVLAVGGTMVGLFLILGVLPKVCSFLMAVVVIIAIIKIYGPRGFFLAKGGFEYQLLILSACISIMISGAGKYSLFDKL